jgi:hypothetical protein
MFGVPSADAVAIVDGTPPSKHTAKLVCMPGAHFSSRTRVARQLSTPP